MNLIKRNNEKGKPKVVFNVKTFIWSPYSNEIVYGCWSPPS